MNWDAIGAIGQLLGSIAVFVTLVYLAIQTRHTRWEMQRSISQNRAEGARELAMSHATNERLDVLHAKVGDAIGAVPNPVIAVFMERAGLTLEEATALMWEQSAFWAWRSQAIAYVDELPDGERIQFDSGLRLNYGTLPVRRLWYQAIKASLNPEAVGYIDNLLAQPS